MIHDYAKMSIRYDTRLCEKEKMVEEMIACILSTIISFVLVKNE